MLTLSGRKIFFVGLNTGLVTNGLPDSRCCDFYARRSGHGLYCCIVGNVVIPAGIGTNKNTAEISNSAAWHQLAAAIRSNGALPGIQLATTWDGYSGQRKFVAALPANEIARYRKIAGEISGEDVERLFLALHTGTRLAIDAGFRHIQLHAAHGYLFSLLVDERIYSHAEHVIAKIVEWAKSVRAYGAEVSLRFSLKTGDAAFDGADGHEFSGRMAALPMNYLDVSSGFYEIDKRLIYPSLGRVLDERRRETFELAARHSDVQFIYSGKSARVPAMELPQNVHLGICRDLIANPNFIDSPEIGCVNSMKCHWYSRNKDNIECGRWI